MTNWHESDVLANGIRLHVYRASEEPQPDSASRSVILVHGITDNGLCWPAVADALVANYDVITYDARCHGKSETPRRSPTWQDMGDDLAALVEALGLDKPYALGHSMGGATVAIASAEHPDLLGKAALSDPALGIGASDPDEAAEWRASWRADLLAKKALPIQEIIAGGKRSNPNWPSDVFEGWALAKQQVDPSALDLVGAELTDWRDLARRTTCPTLLLWADTERGSIVSQAQAQEMVALLAQGQAAHFDAGHNIRREARDAYIAAVQAFFAS